MYQSGERRCLELLLGITASVWCKGGLAIGQLGVMVGDGGGIYAILVEVRDVVTSERVLIAVSGGVGCCGEARRYGVFWCWVDNGVDRGGGSTLVTTVISGVLILLCEAGGSGIYWCEEYDGICWCGEYDGICIGSIVLI